MNLLLGYHHGLTNQYGQAPTEVHGIANNGSGMMVRLGHGQIGVLENQMITVAGNHVHGYIRQNGMMFLAQ